MQAQQVFDAAATFLRLQKERCYDKALAKCLYRNKHGLTCVAGFFIKDKLYRPSFENQGGVLESEALQEALELSGFNLEHLELLDAFQIIHDNESRPMISGPLYALAAEFELNSYVVDCIYPVDFENQPQMTGQQIFDVAATFLRLQKEACSISGLCRYRYEGRCCVAGFFIKDKYYLPCLEDRFLTTSMVVGALTKSGFPEVQLPLLRDLQIIHDRAGEPRQAEIKGRLLDLYYDPSIVNCIFP